MSRLYIRAGLRVKSRRRAPCLLRFMGTTCGEALISVGPPPQHFAHAAFGAELLLANQSLPPPARVVRCECNSAGSAPISALRFRLRTIPAAFGTFRATKTLKRVTAC